MSHTLAFNSTLPVLKRLSLIWDNFNIHHIGLVVRRVFQNQPQVHTPNSIHNCGKSKQWINISSCQFNNLIKIPHRHIVAQIAIHKNSCAWIIKQFFVRAFIFLVFLVQLRMPHQYLHHSCPCFYSSLRCQVRQIYGRLWWSYASKLKEIHIQAALC